MASDSYAGEPFFDNYTTYFGSAAFMDKFVMDALNGKETSVRTCREFTPMNSPAVQLDVNHPGCRCVHHSAANRTIPILKYASAALLQVLQHAI